MFSFQGIEVVCFRLSYCDHLVVITPEIAGVKGVFAVPGIAQDEPDLATEKDAGGEAIRLASLPESYC